MDAPSIGVFLPTMSPPGEVPGDPAGSARHAEDLELESVWVVDQLVAGTGAPFVDSTVALAAAERATNRVRLGFGVMIVPLHPVVWVAKQIGSLQHVSRDRVILGVGAGGDRHERSWLAAGVPRRERGRRTDAGLRVLPSLVSGAPTRLGDEDDSPTVQLSPPATVPPIVVGGMSDAALRRAVDHADGWFLLPVPPDEVARAGARMGEVAAARGRPAPPMTASMMVAIEGDPSLPDHDALVRTLSDVDGVYGMPAEAADSIVVRGEPATVAARLSQYADSGAERVVITLVAGDWRRQVELLAEAQALLT
jgi:alkanesulfonate monooxygenase SsuD/methylene tetrahydromethanopterin reductase-like flavin-dependent oxidoreductase (luciferase family)